MLNASANREAVQNQGNVYVEDLCRGWFFILIT